MRLLDEAKTFFWLRRLTLAVERQADSLDRLVKLAEADAQHPRPLVKKAEVGLMDPDEVTKQWLRHMEADRDGIELDD
jgi:hypothetical protein